jgi:hypothetical protein
MLFWTFLYPGGTQACGHSKPCDMDALASGEEWIPPEL